MDAIDKFDPTRDNKFKTYAEFRVRGAILDELELKIGFLVQLEKRRS